MKKTLKGGLEALVVFPPLFATEDRERGWQGQSLVPGLMLKAGPEYTQTLPGFSFRFPKLVPGVGAILVGVTVTVPRSSFLVIGL